MALHERPRKKAKQPSAAEQQQLMDWVRGRLDQIALAHAGDPGPVVLRPDGTGFSPSTSARDWSDEALAKIRAVYAKHTTTGTA